MGRPNIVLIVADTLSAFHLPIHGYDRDTAPFLTDLARENCYAEYAYANGPWTFPSHASMFSGKLPTDHGTTTQDKPFRDRSFVQDLSEAGYRTFGISNNTGICDGLGFGKGFEELDVIDFSTLLAENGATALAGLSDGYEESFLGSARKYFDFLGNAFRDGPVRQVRKALEYRRAKDRPGGAKVNFVNRKPPEITNDWIRDRLADVADDEEFFLFVNYVEQHHPYLPPDEFVSKFADDPARMKADHVEKYKERAAYQWLDVDENLLAEAVDLYDAS
ncbi:MAG: sulfatase-like hydrolase/transferase, partial [Candidatus Nanohaloarchaea archaeon]|nr:sulfatase-like hydrolase/transferase [Candidatus Nanohaloarchaea archaeon]